MLRFRRPQQRLDRGALVDSGVPPPKSLVSQGWEVLTVDASMDDREVLGRHMPIAHRAYRQVPT